MTLISDVNLSNSLLLQTKINPLPPGKDVLLFASKPTESSFTLPAGKAYPFSFLRFSLRPSAFAVLSGLYRQTLVVLFMALALAGLIGWLLSRWIARPLSHLAAATEAVAEGNFLETVERTGIFELDRLADQFNRMVLRLRESFRSLRAERDAAQRFAADAAHGLKTPVTTLRAYHELVSEQPGRLNQVLPAFGRQIERMEQINTGLLQITNLGEGTGITLEPADLCAVIRRLGPDYLAFAKDSGLHLTVDCPACPVPVLLDQRLLELALNNLVDNACKYTPTSGQVALNVHSDDQNAVITVSDSGKGIPAEELRYIFERFHRGIDNQSIPGTGLGLAIAREAVLRMGGTITADSEVGQGARFFICMPLQQNI